MPLFLAIFSGRFGHFRAAAFVLLLAVLVIYGRLHMWCGLFLLSLGWLQQCALVECDPEIARVMQQPIRLLTHLCNHNRPALRELLTKQPP